ncbi:hypothetical protein E2542_SST10362 [Spatholobus suberectus]|nr:hypothetical protein E2542_SST10362 [Spatholobus suberectus]
MMGKVGKHEIVHKSEVCGVPSSVNEAVFNVVSACSTHMASTTRIGRPKRSPFSGYSGTFPAPAARLYFLILILDGIEESLMAIAALGYCVWVHYVTFIDVVVVARSHIGVAVEEKGENHVGLGRGERIVTRLRVVGKERSGARGEAWLEVGGVEKRHGKERVGERGRAMVGGRGREEIGGEDEE